LGSRWAVSTSSFNCDRQCRRGDCWPASPAASWSPAGTACNSGRQQGLSSRVHVPPETSTTHDLIRIAAGYCKNHKQLRDPFVNSCAAPTAVAHCSSQH
jgi:hypothetical protein